MTRKAIYLSIIILFIISTVWNLGIFTLTKEEPRRVVIALEMIHSNDYLQPTFQGQPYFKKPPLYNWLLAGIYNITGDTSEFNSRLISALSLLAIGLLCFLICTKSMSKSAAFITALLCCITPPLYFSMSYLAEIDTFYSFISLSSILIIYPLYQRKNKYLLFAIPYFVAAIGILTKSPQSLLFVLFTLTGYLLYKKDWRLLISRYHLTGIIFLITPIGLYLYMHYAHGTLQALIETLFSETSERTPAGHSITAFAQYFVTFPFKLLYLCLPASLLIPFIRWKGLWSYLHGNPFIAFCIVAFASNTWLYWFMPGSKDRYIMMLLPLAIIPISHLFINRAKSYSKHFKYINLSLTALLFVSCCYLPFSPIATNIPDVKTYSWILAVIFMVLIGVQLKYSKQSLLILIFIVISIRLGIDSIYFKERELYAKDQHIKDTALHISQITDNEIVYLYDITYVHSILAAYLEIKMDQTLTRSSSFPTSGYIISSSNLSSNKIEEIEHFSIHGETFYLSRVKPDHQQTSYIH
ncbi:ArnT family glycosyltransferase [Fulvivirga ligni]|uniref:ArnT family glycosyltransferase n=1 Tax=Fulvivirga ligni TaxID=2904246 RepID=UPI001F34256C|nr:glycosyltransferase family 39 protein [Fulvivirga ligni]UII22926.1 glycosyltransferase family 39 protein [Fulvivirga ligni]